MASPRRAMKIRLLAGCAFAAAALNPALALAQLAPSGDNQMSSGGLAPVITQAGQTTDITLGAPRTIMNWSSYNLASDQTVVYRFQDRSWIVLNKVAGAATIDGQIEAFVDTQRGAGNVWFSAPGGVMFGPNARVNVGGLLATPAGVSANFLDATRSSFDFSGGGAGQVTVRNGARLQAGGGALALIGGSVVTEDGSSILGTGKSTVLYGAAGDFTVRFAAQPGDLDLLDFVVPAGAGTPSASPLTLAGQTTAGNVILAVVNRAEVASAVINAPGFIAAQTATADGGDVILTAGVDVVGRQPTATRGNATTATTARFGVVTAQRDLLAGFSAPTTLTSTQLAAGRDLGVAVASFQSGAINAGRGLAISADRGITLDSGASAGSSAVFRSSGAMTVGAGSGDVAAVGPLQIAVGTLQAGKLNSGGSIAVSASGAGANNAAAVNLATILAGDDIAVTTSNAAGSIVVGSVAITGAAADTGLVGRNLTLTASGASADVTYGVVAGSPLTGATKVVLKGGRDVTANVAGLLSLGAGSSAGRTFTIRAADLDITGRINAPTIKIEALNGGITLGGAASGASPLRASAGDGNLRLTDAEFQNLQVTDQLSLFAGSPGGTLRGDIIILDLNLNPANVPRFLLGAGAGNQISVTGMFAPTTSGGALVLGDISGNGFEPGRILVSGAIGVSSGSAQQGFTGVRAFDTVALNATTDVILGSSRFIGIVTTTPPGQIDVSRNLPAGVAPIGDEIGRIYLTAGELSLTAPTKIVQQNTGTPDAPNGFFLSNHPSNPTTTLLSVTPAQVVDLYGTLRDADGTLRSGRGISPASIRVNYANGNYFNGDVQLNGVSLGSDSPTGPVAIMAAVQQGAQVSSVTAAAADPATSSTVETAATLIAPPPQVIQVAPPPIDEVSFESVDVGAGSEELWRKRRK